MLPPGQQHEILKLEFFNSCFFSRGGKEADVGLMWQFSF
jgi:hypothetical protein